MEMSTDTILFIINNAAAQLLNVHSETDQLVPVLV